MGGKGGNAHGRGASEDAAGVGERGETEKEIQRELKRDSSVEHDPKILARSGL